MKILQGPGDKLPIRSAVKGETTRRSINPAIKKQQYLDSIAKPQTTVVSNSGGGRSKSKSRFREMANGGQLNPEEGVNLDPNQLAQLLAGITDATTTDERGVQSKGGAIAGGALRFGGMGAKLGSVAGPIGTAVGAGAGAIVGGVIGAANNKKAKEAFNVQNFKDSEGESMLATQLAKAKEDNYNKGVAHQSYFKKGGKLPFEIIGNQTVKVHGKKHEQGGVKIGNSEVERGEVIHGDKVFSDRIKVRGNTRTYAEVATQVAAHPMYRTLADKREKAELIVKNPKNNQYKQGSAMRALQTISEPMDELFEMQEAQKQSQNIKSGGMKYASGGKIKKCGMGGRLVLANGGKLGYEENPFVKGVGYVASYLKKKQGMMDKRALAVEDQSGKLTPRSNPNEGYPPTPLLNPGLVGAISGADAGAAPVVADSRNGNTDSKSLPITGKKILNSLGQLVPYADNITNAILTQRSPHVPAPRLVTAPTLKTDYNIQPQLGAIGRGGAARNRMLKNSATGGSELRSSLIAGNVQDIEAKNSLLGMKENQETELKNKQAIINSDAANVNSGIKNDYNFRRFQRAADIQTRTSQNAANAVEDVQQQIIDKKLQNVNDEDLALLYTKYKKSGVLDRLKLGEVRKKMSQGMSAEDAVKMVG